MSEIFKKNETIVYIIAAFIFSLTIHLMWQFVFGDNPNYYWNGQLMIDTNDGYFFASGVQHEMFGMHGPNPLVPTTHDRGLVFVTYYLAKILPFSLDTIIFYMPAVVASFIVVGIVLIGKLYNKPFWGFLSALVGGIAWSYYNRTLVGYYDTDMFALTIPVFILYFLLKSIKTFELKDAFFAALLISVYEFLYLPGKTVAYAVGLAYVLYLAYLYYFENKDSKLFKFAILIFIALSRFYMPIFTETIFKLILVIAAYFILNKKEFPLKTLMIASAVLLAYFFISSEALLSIWGKIVRYTETGATKDSLHFYGVFQTISEASGIPMFPDGSGGNNVAYRIIGSVVGFFIFIAGYIVLVLRHKEFLIALPLVGIGLFAHWGGLRFTVYAVPIAALSAVYLLFIISEYIKNSYAKVAFLLISTAALLYPNIMHTTKYNAGTVFSKNEVVDLTKLNKISNPKDFTLTWWDYGYPIWYYSDTISLIDGGKHHEDNFIISKIFLSKSPQFAANFAKLSVEEFALRDKYYKELQDGNITLKDVPARFKLKDKDGKEHVTSSHAPIIKTILRVNQKDQKDPYEFLASLENSDFKLPKKSRDVYLYAPLKMSNIFLTVSKFGNINLKTGKSLGNMWFYPTYARSQKGYILGFSNGILFDIKNGELITNKSKIPVKYYINVNFKKNGDIEVMPKKYAHNGDKVVMFIRNTRRFILMDIDALQSNYVQMFLLGNYDKDLFELVVKSPSSRVYRVK